MSHLIKVHAVCKFSYFYLRYFKILVLSFFSFVVMRFIKVVKTSSEKKNIAPLLLTVLKDERLNSMQGQ